MKVFFEIGLHSLQHCSINLGNFNANSFFQILLCTEFILIHVCLEGSLQEIITNGQTMGLREAKECQQNWKWGDHQREGEACPLMLWLCGPSLHSAETTHPIGTHFRHNSGTKKLLIILVLCSGFTVTAFPLLFFKKKWIMTAALPTAHQTVTFGLCCGFVCSSLRFSRA